MTEKISFNEELKTIIDMVQSANKTLSNAMAELDILMEELLKKQEG